MNIHGKLAVLMMTTALGTFAPITVWQLYQHRVYGWYDGLSVRTSSWHSLLGTRAGETLFDGRAHTIVGLDPSSVIDTSISQHTILGMKGLAGLSLSAHAAIQTEEFSGYGTDYGGSYGG